MISKEAWKDIDMAGLKRAQFINNCYLYWNNDIDSKCKGLHNTLAMSVQGMYPELYDLSLQTVKDMIASASEEYVVPEAKTYLKI